MSWEKVRAQLRDAMELYTESCDAKPNACYLDSRERAWTDCGQCQYRPRMRVQGKVRYVDTRGRLGAGCFPDEQQRWATEMQQVGTSGRGKAVGLAASMKDGCVGILDSLEILKPWGERECRGGPLSLGSRVANENAGEKYTYNSRVQMCAWVGWDEMGRGYTCRKEDGCDGCPAKEGVEESAADEVPGIETPTATSATAGEKKARVPPCAD
ncbi:hypothetical protein FB451DRAFT_1366046 [Mycena latifolia]|nr:hypothetical protein FB451DRAFT_1366046 [Mycena latifolia]